MDAVWIIFLFALGACVGSFLNVVIYRLPRGESIAFPGSHCPSCGRGIRWHDNIPLVSWLLLRAKCRSCKAPISPRYILVEFITAVLVAGLYVCYYVLRLRSGAGDFEATWPMFLAHAMLICGLLACAAIDIEHWIVPLEACWLVSLVGIVAASASPHPWMPEIAPPTGAMALAGTVGLAASILLQRRGILQPSFLDAQDKPLLSSSATPKDKPPAGDDGKASAQASEKGAKTDKKGGKPKKGPISVAATREHGVDPRREVLREVLFLSPAIALAAITYFLTTQVAPVRLGWIWLTDATSHGAMGGAFGRHFSPLLAALYGYLIGGLLVWGTRILGTLAFGKEAMGLGDVHLMAAVGAVTGWIVPTLAFFIAPFFGLLWALYLWLRRNQRELPYGPWLAIGTLAVMLLYDRLSGFIQAYLSLSGD